jgi:hypothetical protein
MKPQIAERKVQPLPMSELDDGLRHAYQEARGLDRDFLCATHGQLGNAVPFTPRVIENDGEVAVIAFPEQQYCEEHEQPEPGVEFIEFRRASLRRPEYGFESHGREEFLARYPLGEYAAQPKSINPQLLAAKTKVLAVLVGLTLAVRQTAKRLFGIVLRGVSVRTRFFGLFHRASH